MKAVDHFYLLNQQGLHFLNQAFVVLIPMKENPKKSQTICQLALAIVLQN
jgi:hypothetical protein